jgi:murein L,D-transpeptidase YcbB/YkuD
MNIPVGKRIKQLLLIWNAVDGFQMTSQNQKNWAINIPAYQLTYFRDGKTELRSNVVVGKVMNQTVIFSAQWNLVFILIEYIRRAF